MKTKLVFTLPSGEIGFVENKRAFCVQGKIISGEKIPDNALLKIELFDSNNNLLRHIECNKKNKEIVPYYDGLTGYKEELDPGRKLMIDFGFPELIVDDINNPHNSIKNACIKCWYNDDSFKGIIINASDTSNGALLDDGMNFTDENGEAYSLLEIGEYTLKASLVYDGDLITSSFKKLVIGKRKNQVICRFNPISHKQRMLDWCKENDFSIIEDLIPGYLDPYLGKWYYHMGLLQMYRANDVCMYEDAKIEMFVYLIDSSSTSYETEFAYLESCNALADSNRFTFYHYDIGEAFIGKSKTYERKAKILEFNENEDIYLCRIDVLNKQINDNLYYLDERYTKDVIYDFNDIKLSNGDDIAIMGVLKPKQLDPNDFILRKDNTYEILNEPNIMRYTFNIDNDKFIIDKKTNMLRIEDEPIGNSIYEFYNVFHIEEEWKNLDIEVMVECIDKKGNVSDTFKKFIIRVN